MGECVLNRNGSTLLEVLLALLVLGICSLLIAAAARSIWNTKGMLIHEQLETEWYYTP
ncbi:MAG: prepilin-type N-terminal cleavage/methylation domain-containing protein [Faecalicoccus sp.]|nr:prepilin-type N-terminal cleavage/methylation domain-containing protein [Faecalicoccus sp.]